MIYAKNKTKNMTQRRRLILTIDIGVASPQKKPLAIMRGEGRVIWAGLVFRFVLVRRQRIRPDLFLE